PAAEQVAEYLGVVLAEQRGRPTQFPAVLREAVRRGRVRPASGARVLDRLEEAARGQLRPGEDAVDRVDREGRHADGLGGPGDLVLGALARPLGQQRLELGPVGGPGGPIAEALVFGPGRIAHHLEPARPEVLLARRDRDLAVRGRQDRDDAAGWILAPAP